MPEKIALMALGRSSLPTGKIVLVGELADGVSRRDLARVLADRSVELADVPPQRAVAPAPSAPSERPWTDALRPPAVAPKPAPAPIVNAPKLQTTAGPRPSPPLAVPKAPVTGPKPDEFAGKSSGEVRAAIERTRKLDEAVRDMAAKHDRPAIIKMAKKLKVTFSARGTKLEIAREILEDQAKPTKR